MATPNGENDELRMAGFKAAVPAVVEAIKSNREIVGTAREQQSANWRAAVGAVGKWEAARRTGEGKAMIDALVDLTAMELADSPVDREMLRRVEEQVRLAQPGVSPSAESFKRAMWQVYSEQNPAPEADPRTLGTFRAMQDKYPWSDSYITDKDKVAWANYQRIVKQADIQAGEVERMEKVREQARSMADYLARNPDAQPTEVQQYMKNLPLLGDSAAMQGIAAYAKKQANADPVLSKEEREQYEQNDALRKTLERKVIDDANTESERDRMARIIAKPKFQWWAKMNGFDVGTVSPKEEGKNYGPDVLTPVGEYTSGPDDMEAIKYAMGQRKRRGDQDMFWQHRRLPGTPTFGQVTVKYGTVPDAAYKGEGGTYKFIEENGQRTYLKPDEVEARQAALEQQAKKWVEEMKAEPTPENVARMLDGFAGKIQETTDAPPKDTTQVIRGQFMAPRAGDPEGSVRLKGYPDPFMPDQIVGEPEVTSGGTERQTLARFASELAKRSAANREERQRETAPRPRADELAATLVPELDGKGDKNRREDVSYKREMNDRRDAEYAADIADEQKRDPRAVLFDLDALKRPDLRQQENADAVAESTGAAVRSGGRTERGKAADVAREAFNARMVAGITQAPPRVEAYDTSKDAAYDTSQMKRPVPPVNPLAQRGAPPAGTNTPAPAPTVPGARSAGQVPPAPDLGPKPTPPRKTLTGQQREAVKPQRLGPPAMEEPDFEFGDSSQDIEVEGATRDTLVTPSASTTMPKKRGSQRAGLLGTG